MANRIKIVSRLLVTLLLLIATGGCRPNNVAAPLASGLLESVTIWDKPPAEAGNNVSHPGPQGSRVEVYEQFILITPPDGSTALVPHGWYTDLKFDRRK